MSDICEGCGKEIRLIERKDVVFFIIVRKGDVTHSTMHRVHLDKECIKLYLNKLKEQFGVEDES